MKFDKLGPIIAACTLAVTSTGCVPGKTYHTHLSSPPLCSVQRPHDCASEMLYELSNQGTSPPPLVSFVEFDDLGHIREEGLADALMSDIRTIGEDRPVLLVAFAHGWKHNADPRDGNVRDFTKVIAKIAKADAALCKRKPCEGRQVVGIYLGWRGLSNRYEPFETLTFWGRKAVAQEVGSDGAARVLAELGQIKSRETKHNRGQNVLIAIGHSFGSALIYESLKQSLIRDAGLSESGKLSHTTADMVILVNPAFEAARFETLRRIAQDLNPDPGQAPLLAVFTSESDLATKIAFPLGRKITTIFTEYSRDAVHDDERKQNTTALGHFQRFWTHTLSVIPTGQPEESEKCRFTLFTEMRSDHLRVGKMVLTRLEVEDPARYESPLWVVHVSRDLIQGHSGIW